MQVPVQPGVPAHHEVSVRLLPCHYSILGLPPCRTRRQQQGSRRSDSKKPFVLQSASRPQSLPRSSPCQSAAAAQSRGGLLLEGPSRPGAVSAHLATQALSHSR